MTESALYVSSAVMVTVIGFIMYELYKLNGRVARIEEDIKWVKSFLLKNGKG